MSLLRYVTYNFESLYTNVFFLLFAHLYFTLSPSLHYIPSFYSAQLHSSLFHSNSILFHSNLLSYTLLLDYSTLLSSALLSVTSYYTITSYLTLLFSFHLASTPFLPTPPPSGPLTPIQLTILPSIPLYSSILPHSSPLHSCPFLSALHQFKNSAVKKYLCLSCLQPGV